MKRNRRILQLPLMFFISLVTQCVVMLRSAAVAGIFGVGAEIDAYNAVHSVANFLFSFISSGVTTVLIPAYLQKKSDKSVNGFLTLLYLFGLGAICVSGLLQKPILYLFSSGQAGFVETGCAVFLITMLSQFFNTQLGVTTAFFQVKDNYNLPKVCTLISNLAQLALILLDSQITVYRYALYVALTTVANAVVQLIICAMGGYRYRFTLAPRDVELHQMIRVFVPTVFSTGVYQISLLTDSLLSSRLGSGQITILSYSNQVVALVNALVLSNITTFLYPKIVASLEESNANQQKKLFGFIHFSEAIAILLLAGFIAVGEDAVSLLYEHGKFESENTKTVFQCMCLYMMGFPINMVRDVVYRFFYAKGNTKETFKNGFLVSVVNFVFSIILAQYIGIYGIILGTIFSSAFSLIMILWRMIKNYGFHYSKRKLLTEQGKIILSLLVTLTAVFLLKQAVNLSAVWSILVFGCTTVVIFVVMIIIMKSDSVKVKF